MVRNYTDEQLLKKVKSLESFVSTPQGHWILGVRSNEDLVDRFDDKFYLFKGEKFIDVIKGTTNTGKYGLLNFRKWNKKGVAQIKSNEWYYSVWKRGLHKGKMEALVQKGEFKVIRDGNKNLKSGDVEEWSYERNNGLNFHGPSYKPSNIVKKLIGRWSIGCQVPAKPDEYFGWMRLTQPQKSFTYCLIDEFTPCP